MMQGPLHRYPDIDLAAPTPVSSGLPHIFTPTTHLGSCSMWYAAPVGLPTSAASSGRISSSLHRRQRRSCHSLLFSLFFFWDGSSDMNLLLRMFWFFSFYFNGSAAVALFRDGFSGGKGEGIRPPGRSLNDFKTTCMHTIESIGQHSLPDRE